MLYNRSGQNSLNKLYLKKKKIRVNQLITLKADDHWGRSAVFLSLAILKNNHVVDKGEFPLVEGFNR